MYILLGFWRISRKITKAWWRGSNTDKRGVSKDETGARTVKINALITKLL